MAGILPRELAAAKIGQGVLPIAAMNVTNPDGTKGMILREG